MRHHTGGFLAAALFLVVLGLPAAAQQEQQQQPQPPQGGRGQGRGQRQQNRDAQRPVAPEGTAVIAGRVLAADSGRPLKRARVMVFAPGGRGGRAHAATTDELGRYRVDALPAGTYTVSATKTGYVDSQYGQRRAALGGTPIELADAQQLANVDLRLQRGGVITGRILDEDGEPLARATVTVLRYQYLRGQKQLMPAGADLSDDRGAFRIFGLPPGEYLVSATATGPGRIIAPLIEAAGGRGLAIRSITVGRGGGPGGGRGFVEEEPESTGYAPTYYPGAITSADAARLRLAAAQELAGLDFQLQLVPLATIRGTVAEARGNVILVPEDGVGGLLAQGLRAPVQADGSWMIRNVPPGKYTAVAIWEQGLFGSETSSAMQPLTISGSDLVVALVPVKGARIVGNVTFESSGAPTPATYDGFRVNAVPLDNMIMLPRTSRPAEVQGNGVFELTGLIPGRYAIQANGARGWTMKTATLAGRDVSDEPFEIRGGESLTELNVVFVDRTSGASGTVRSGTNPAPAGLTVIAFPAEDKLWRPQSRRIQTARTDQAGVFRFNSLPPGDYLIVAVDDVESGEWFDPTFLESVRDRAARFSLDEGEQKTVDLKWSASA
jgi:protocatechuate 3,4-dioxygenase beta subunit